MKTTTNALKVHYQGETTTIARLWKITLKHAVQRYTTDSPPVLERIQVIGFTDHDTDIVYPPDVPLED